MNYFIYFLILGMIICGLLFFIPRAYHSTSNYRIVKKFKTYPSHSEEEYFYPQVKFLWFFWRGFKIRNLDETRNQDIYYCLTEKQAKAWLQEYLVEHSNFKQSITYYENDDLLNKEDL